MCQKARTMPAPPREAPQTPLIPASTHDHSAFRFAFYTFHFPCDLLIYSSDAPSSLRLLA